MGGAAADDDSSVLEALGSQMSASGASDAVPGVQKPSPAEPPSRRELGLDVLRTLNGGDPAAEANLRGRAGDLADSVLDFAMGEVWQGSALDRKTRSLQVVAMLASLGRLGPLRGHVRGALNHGATPDQVVETLKMVTVYAGFPAAVEAWPVVMEVFKERGITRDPGL
jgi:4-carboxymuconolactone decarboxylase